MVRRVRLLDGNLDVMTSDEVMRFIADAVLAERKAVIANHNFHSLCLTRRDAKMAAFYETADVVEIDSMPLLFWGRLLGHKLRRDHRCTYLDWRDRFWRMADEKKWRVYCLGSTPAANAAALERLRESYPGLTVAGRDGYFDPAPVAPENRAVLEAINAFRPDVVLVGMGMPRQEIWIHDNYGALASGVVLPVGAAFDYEAGLQKPAPRIYGQLSLEWLYRLAHNPTRLYRRYLIEPWDLLGPAMMDVTRRILAEPPREPRRRRRRPSAQFGAEVAAAETQEDLSKAA